MCLCNMFAKKRYEADNNMMFMLDFGFIQSLFDMFKLRKKIDKIKYE